MPHQNIEFDCHKHVSLKVSVFFIVQRIRQGFALSLIAGGLALSANAYALTPTAAPAPTTTLSTPIPIAATPDGALSTDTISTESSLIETNASPQLPASVIASAQATITDTASNNEQAVVTTNAVLDHKFPSIDTSILKRLAQHPQWQHLLFYKNNQAEVISPGFYLTDSTAKLRRSFSPYQELLATLKQAGDPQSVCKYPARYLWLQQQLVTEKLPEINVDFSRCPDLPDAQQKISLLLVSSYLKNPASSFGHVLIKTNTTDDMNNEAASANSSLSNGLSSEDLLNNAYNFGARIPQNENGALYAIKGLFGVYDAGFAEAEFFKQDAVYAKNEQRDMWEYVLNLAPFETQLLNYHMYEAKSARFDYYFIKQNCGYRSGEVLELISGIKTTERLGSWYAPDYVFDQLVEYNETAQSPLIASVRYLPSEQTQLRQRFTQISKPLQAAINEYIRTEQYSALETLSQDEQATALDFLVMHRNYKISQDGSEHHRTVKKQLLSQRFTLPASDTLATLPLQTKLSPALSNKTTQTAVTLSEQSAQVALSLFVKDPLNTYTDIDKRFEAMQVAVSYDLDKDDWALENFTFLDMQQIENLAQPLAGEPKLSWQLQTGARRDPVNQNAHSAFAQAGVGVGAMWGEYLLGYGLVNAAAHDQEHHLDASLELGMRAKRNGQAAELTYTASKRESKTLVQQTQLRLRQQLNKNNDVRAAVTYLNNDNLAQETTTASLAWHHYW